jgi:hypothetical protein
MKKEMQKMRLECILEDLGKKDHGTIIRVAESLNMAHTECENQVLRLADRLTKDQLIGICVYLAGHAINWSHKRTADREKIMCDENDFNEVAIAHEIYVRWCSVPTITYHKYQKAS